MLDLLHSLSRRNDDYWIFAQPPAREGKGWKTMDKAYGAALQSLSKTLAIQ